MLLCNTLKLRLWNTQNSEKVQWDSKKRIIISDRSGECDFFAYYEKCFYDQGWAWFVKKIIGSQFLKVSNELIHNKIHDSPQFSQIEFTTHSPKIIYDNNYHDILCESLDELVIQFATHEKQIDGFKFNSQFMSCRIHRFTIYSLSVMSCIWKLNQFSSECTHSCYGKCVLSSRKKVFTFG